MRGCPNEGVRIMQVGSEMWDVCKGHIPRAEKLHRAITMRDTTLHQVAENITRERTQ